MRMILYEGILGRPELAEEVGVDVEVGEREMQEVPFTPLKLLTKIRNGRDFLEGLLIGGKKARVNEG